MTDLPPTPDPDRLFYVKAIVAIVGIPVLLIAVILWIRPTAEERFASCMALAENAGLLDANRDAAALVCLRGATERGGNGDGGPNIGISPDGSVTVVP